MQLPSATPDFATASMIVFPISGVINRIAALPSATECGRNNRRDKDGAHESSPACVGQLTRQYGQRNANRYELTCQSPTIHRLAYQRRERASPDPASSCQHSAATGTGRTLPFAPWH